MTKCLKNLKKTHLIWSLGSIVFMKQSILSHTNEPNRSEPIMRISKLVEKCIRLFNYRNSIKITHKILSITRFHFVFISARALAVQAVQAVQLHLNVTQFDSINSETALSLVSFLSVRLMFFLCVDFLPGKIHMPHFPPSFMCCKSSRSVCMCVCVSAGADVKLCIFNHNRHQLTNCFAVPD